MLSKCKKKINMLAVAGNYLESCTGWCVCCYDQTSVISFTYHYKELKIKKMYFLREIPVRRCDCFVVPIAATKSCNLFSH